MDSDVMKKLAFISYIFRVGTEQSRQPEPMNAISLLSFHDAVELFLDAATKHLNVSKSDLGFMEYWRAINTKLDQQLTQQPSMHKLNKARVQLKHHGILPSRMDVESFRNSTRNFFLENTPAVFKIEFQEISLLDLIHNQRVKDELLKAQNSMKSNQTVPALESIAVSFAYLLDDYERDERAYASSPFNFGPSFSVHEHHLMNESGKTGEFIKKVSGSLNNLRAATKILCLGLDYRKYVKFTMTTPRLISCPSGLYTALKTGDRDMEDCRFCFDYVVECAMHLQDFDYDASRST